MSIFSTALIVVKDGHYIYLPGGGGGEGGGYLPQKTDCTGKTEK